MTARPKQEHMYVIYDHPDDYPQHFVVRRWDLHCRGGYLASDYVRLCDTLAETRDTIGFLDPSLIVIPRFEKDDPKIVEVWL